MKRRDARSWWVATVVSLVFWAGPVGVSPGTAQSLESALRSEVESARKQLKGMGVHVEEVRTGRSVYGYRSTDDFILASNTKILTTATALDGLGPGYQFETRLMARGEVQDGVLRGDLAVVGGADPSISGRDYMGDSFGVFRAWARTLREQGVRQVSGNLFLDHGYFPSPLHHPDWDRAKNQNWYQVPVDSLGFYENVVQVRMHPGSREGQTAKVELIPPVPFYDIENRVKTTSSWKTHRLGVRRTAADPDDAETGDPEMIDGGAETGELEVWGGVYRRAPYLDAYVAVLDPVGYFGAAMKTAFAEEGIRIGGSVRPVEKLPGLTWREVDRHRTDLLTLIEVTNRESQNFYAESIVRVLGAELCRQGTWENGARIVTEFLEQAGLEPGTFTVRDGSGLSRKNRMTPRQMTTLLRYMASHPYAREFQRSLPHGGQEGSSLKKRMTKPPYRDNVFAKTGTLTGVTALSGYAKGRSGKLYAFSVLVNDAAIWRGRQLQDEVAKAIVDHG